MDDGEYKRPEHSSSLLALRAMNSFKQRINHKISTNRPLHPSIIAKAVLFSASDVVCSDYQRSINTGFEYN